MSIVLNPWPAQTTLIDAPRAEEIPILLALSETNPSLLNSLIASASAAIQNFCKRVFCSSPFTEYYNGGNLTGVGAICLQLREFPVLSVARIAADPQGALLVTNTSTANQRATIATTSSGIVLQTVASGVVAAPITLAYTSYVTIQLLANAIAAQGNGWTCQVQSPYANWASSDLRPLQGAATCLYGGAMLAIYVEDIPAYGVPWAGLSAFNGGGAYGPWGWQLDAGPGQVWGYFPAGVLNIRVDYTAGFVEIPSDVQQACVQLVLEQYDQTTKATNLGSESIEGYSYTNGIAFSPSIQRMLRPYVAYDKTINR